MKLKKITMIAAAAAILVMALALQALALDFSAEFVEKDGDSVRKGKIYMTGQKSRFEMEGMDSIEVTRADKKMCIRDSHRARGPSRRAAPPP